MSLEEAADQIRRWRESPILFVKECLMVESIDAWQEDYLLALGDPSKQRIGMKACTGPGKTAVLAWTILWFLFCQGDKGNHPKGAGTSITEDNIDDNLWPEIAKWMTRSPILMKAFIWRKERIISRDHPETWFFSKRTWPKSGDKNQQSNTLKGLHSDFILFVLDESGGIPLSVSATAEAALATGRWCKIIQAGNPTHLEGPLYAACTSARHLWHMITITGDPDDPKRSPRVSKLWAQEQIDQFGRDNPWVIVNVFGNFPPSSLNTLLGPDEVEAAMRRHLTPDVYNWSQKRLGVDVARFGDDRTVIFPRQGLAAFRPVTMRKQNTNDIAARVVLARTRWNPEMIFVDDSGHWGHGVIDNLQTGGHPAIGILGESPAIDKRFKNKRTEMWLLMAEWVKKGGALPLIPELTRELTTPTYTFLNGVFQLEPKPMIKKRLGFSPDLADGLAFTFAYPEMPKGDGLLENVPGFKNAPQVKHEYDPFADKSATQQEEVGAGRLATDYPI